MPMSASTFFAHFKKLKAYLAENPDVSDELKHAFAAIAGAFKTAYTAEAFKQALADNQPVDSELEERVTSALILLNRDRTRRAGG